MSIRFFQLLMASSVLVLLNSCVAHKELIVMQEQQEIKENLRSHQVLRGERLVKYKEYKIRTQDQLMIQINAFDGSTEDFLNREFSNSTNTNNNLTFTPESVYFNSYTVDNEGAIYLPMIEKVVVKGMTITALKKKLDKEFSPYLKFPNTSLKIANQRVTIMGEVNNPGVHYLYNEKNSLLDVVAMAGDFTPFANLKKVKLIRQRGTGVETIYINLSAPDFVNTEYFYAYPHDIIYIEPLKAKSLDSSSNSLGIVLSAISIGVLLANIFINK